VSGNSILTHILILSFRLFHPVFVLGRLFVCITLHSTYTLKMSKDSFFLVCFVLCGCVGYTLFLHKFVCVCVCMHVCMRAHAHTCAFLHIWRRRELRGSVIYFLILKSCQKFQFKCGFLDIYL